MHVMRLSALFILLLCLAAGITPVQSPAQAQEGRAVYFEALYDVPVMPGLQELKDQAMLFDKPDGRIASVVAASPTLKPEQIRAFYEETLPQLGWKKINSKQYVRDNSSLTMALETRPPLSILHLTLSPAGAGQSAR